VILVHRLSHEREPFHLNPDLIQTIEAHPDVVVSLTTGVKMPVAETVEEVIAAIRRWRVDIAAQALAQLRN
jgi:flagellar protein FlbD